MEKKRGIKRIILQTVNVLLTTGPSIPNVNLTNGDKETALHCAAQVNIFFNHLRVRLLLEAIMAKLKVELAKWQSDNPSDSVKLCPMCKSVE